MNATKIGTALLKALASIAYDGYERPRINGILFRGGEIIATDGHRLIRVPFKHHADFYMTRDLAITSCAAMTARGVRVVYSDIMGAECEVDDPSPNLTISLVDSDIVVDVGGVKLSAPAGDVASFPPVDKIFENLSSESNPMGHNFNPSLLGGMWDVISAMGDNQYGVKMVSCGGASDPHVYQSEGGVVFALMPMRAPERKKEAA